MTTDYNINIIQHTHITVMHGSKQVLTWLNPIKQKVHYPTETQNLVKPGMYAGDIPSTLTARV